MGRVLVLMILAAVAPARADEPPTPERARAAFALLQQLAGDWEASSTKGWQGRHSMRLIGRGSAILSASNVDPHPGADETMATLFHLDGDRLLLTHYCVARNQPRLVATRISADGREIEFSFLDGTNMRSRDDGHMDRAIFTIESADRYKTRWTFYRNGEESWMEEIVNLRRHATP